MSKNMVQKECDDWWFSHRARVEQAARAIVEEQDYLPMRTLMNARFEAGARWTMIETSRINPIITRFIEMVILLGFDDPEPSRNPGESHV